MLTRLLLRDFRCFDCQEVVPGPEANFFVGANAQGKTSLLEAVSLLLRLQSPRARTLGEMTRHEAPGFRLDAELKDGTRLACLTKARRRVLQLNGAEPTSTNDYLALGRVVWFGNRDLDLVTGRGEQRRRYLDFAGQQVDPGYRLALRRYQRALAGRNALLKVGTQEALEQCRDYDRMLERHGDYLRDARAGLVARLGESAREAQRAIGGAEAEALGMQYRGARPGQTTAEELAAAWERDLRLGQTTAGPHRDDLTLTISGRPAARFASEGQQRTIALALKCAQQRLLSQTDGPPPVLLLDDIFGELDLDRRRALLRFLPAGLQLWITATHLEWAGPLPMVGCRFNVANGQVNPAVF